MTGRATEQQPHPAPGRLDLLSFVVRSVAPNEVRMSRRGSWVPLDFAGVLQRLDAEGAAGTGVSPA